MSAAGRQLKLGAVTYGTGGPGSPYHQSDHFQVAPFPQEALVHAERGSPATVATRIQEWFEARALDGLNYSVGHPSQWRRFREEVIPILQERGIVRTDHESTTLRGNLGLPVPETAAQGRERQSCPARILRRCGTSPSRCPRSSRTTG